MKPSDLILMLNIAIDARIPAHIWGASGVGKSQIVSSIAKKRKIGFIDLRAVQLDPVDLRGLPSIENGITKWNTPEFLPREGEGILFLDELTSAPQMVQAACYQLVLDRALGDYRLPDGWVVMAAGNPASEKGVHFSMPYPLRNRFMHFTLDVDKDDWTQWAITHKVVPELISFIRLKGADLLLGEKPKDSNAWPTPRAWANVSSFVEPWFKAKSALTPLFTEAVGGIVGEGAASEFTGFMRLYQNLPTIEQILLAPETTMVPSATEPSASIVIATGLGRVINDQNVAKASIYLNRMDAEYHTLAIHDAVERDPKIAKTKSFIEFGVRFDKVLA